MCHQLCVSQIAGGHHHDHVCCAHGAALKCCGVVFIVECESYERALVLCESTSLPHTCFVPVDCIAYPFFCCCVCMCAVVLGVRVCVFCS